MPKLNQVTIHNSQLLKMYKLKKRVSVVLMAMLLSGCRSAKPTIASETMADSVSVSAVSSIDLYQDSVIKKEKTKIQTDEVVEFVEGGGFVSISADGSVEMSGVANVKSSGLNYSVSDTESQTFKLHCRSKDSITESHSGTAFSESRQTGSAVKCGIKPFLGIAIFLIFLIMILVAKLKDCIKINH